MTQHLFTSESVSMGHPDKVADQISDAVLDAILSEDTRARVACEALVTGNMAVVAGERNTTAVLDLEKIVRDTMTRIGYDDASGFDVEHFTLVDAVQQQSVDISRGVDRGDDTGAGDQGLMFGYASSQTAELMPLPIMLAHKLVARQAEVRVEGQIAGLRPDAKSQVTIRYDGTTPIAVESILVSTQHHPSWNGRQADLKEAVTEHIIRPVLGDLWDDGATVLVNPTGQFEIGGPRGDTGLTGRKIIVDTYGGWARHGGGAFSGKDATKVDRSASYMARHVAKHVVAAGLARECEVRLGYAIGIADPTAVWVDTHGTGVIDDTRLSKAVRDVFPLTPRGIIDALGLERPIYSPTAYHGHFGRTPGDDGTFSWEATPRIGDLHSAAGA